MSSANHKKIAIHGVPRSGTSWLGEIFNSSPVVSYAYQPLFSYAYKDFLSGTSTRQEIDEFFFELLHSEDEFVQQKIKRISGDMPNFIKGVATHIAYKEVRYANLLPSLLSESPDLMFCGIVRNPLSVINSWLSAPREFREDLGWVVEEEWRYAPKKNMDRPEEFNGYEKWKEAVQLFLRLKAEYIDRVFIVNYSDLLRDPLKQTRAFFDFFGLEFTSQTKNFLQESLTTDSSDAYSVYRHNQTDRKWESELDPCISQEIIADLKGTPLERYLES